jgi:AraC family transcriptional regulator
MPSAARLRVWSGRLCLWEGGALYLGYAADNTPHSHHAAQLCLGLDGTLAVRQGSRSPWHRGRVVVVGPDVMHQLEGGDTTLALAYIDPEADAALRLRAAGYERVATVPLDPLAEFLQPLSDVLRDDAAADEVARLVERMVEALAPAPALRRLPDRRILRAVRELREQVDVPPTAPAMAARLGLSASRFVHVFRDTTGIPYRRYLLWLRLITAVGAMARSRSLTEVAHAAGFADSAHMSRTFRRMFGIAPSALQRGRGA